MNLPHFFLYAKQGSLRNSVRDKEVSESLNGGDEMKRFAVVLLAGMLGLGVNAAQAKQVAQVKMPKLVWSQHIVCTVDHYADGLVTKTCRSWKTGNVPKQENTTEKRQGR